MLLFSIYYLVRFRVSGASIGDGAVFVHDDKLLLTFNFKDGERTITLIDAKIAEEKNTGSNLDCSLVPY